MTQSTHGSPCWYELTTGGIDAAQAFYTAVLGWQIADSGTPGMDYRIAKTGDSMVAGLTPAEDGRPNAWMIYFAVDSADATFAAATTAGATPIVPPADIPNTGRFAIMVDPQGASFGILQPLPGGQGGAFDQKSTNAGHWHEIITGDPMAAMKFYGDLFGWTISRSMQMGPDMTYHLIAWNGLEIGGAFSMSGAPNYWKPYFGVASVKAAVQSVKAAGGTVLRDPDEVPGGAWTLQINDPLGVSLALDGPA
ncbi:MAG: VOC family protein [bacterium]